MHGPVGRCWITGAHAARHAAHSAAAAALREDAPAIGAHVADGEAAAIVAGAGDLMAIEVASAADASVGGEADRAQAQGPRLRAAERGPERPRGAVGARRRRRRGAAHLEGRTRHPGALAPARVDEAELARLVPLATHPCES